MFLVGPCVRILFHVFLESNFMYSTSCLLKNKGVAPQAVDMEFHIIPPGHSFKRLKRHPEGQLQILWAGDKPMGGSSAQQAQTILESVEEALVLMNKLPRRVRLGVLWIHAHVLKKLSFFQARSVGQIRN